MVMMTMIVFTGMAVMAAAFMFMTVSPVIVAMMVPMAVAGVGAAHRIEGRNDIRDFRVEPF